MQAKDLSAELAFTRSVCDNLKEQLYHHQGRCERAESDKKQLKFAVKQLNAKVQEYQLMIHKMKNAYSTSRYDPYEEDDLKSFMSQDSGISDTGVSPMNDKGQQTLEDEVVEAGVQCNLLNMQWLQGICSEIDAQINTVDDIIEQNSNSLGVLGSVFEDYDMVKDVNLEPDGGEGDGAIRELIEEQSTDVSEEILEDGGEEVEEVLEDGGEEVEGFVEVVEYPSPQYLNEEREDEEVLLEDIAEGDEEEEEEYEVTHFDRGC